MKIVKGLLTFIISFILVLLIIVLTASYTVKDVIQHQLIGEVAKKVLVEKIEDENIDDSIIIKMIDDEKTDKIIDSALVDFSSYIEGTSDGVSDETISLIIDFCVTHKADLEELAKKQYEISEIDSNKTRADLKKSLDEAIKSVKIDKNSPVVSVVSTYSKITSDRFRVNVLIIIGCLVLLIGLVNWSLYKWMKSFGSVLITSGIMVLLSYGLSSVLFGLVKDNVDIAISINVMSLLILGIIYLVSGIILLIIYSIINKAVNKKKKQRSMIEDDDDDDEYIPNNNNTPIVSLPEKEEVHDENISSSNGTENTEEISTKNVENNSFVEENNEELNSTLSSNDDNDENIEVL